VSKRELILGVDPGFSGALALYDHVKHVVVAVTDMPIAENKAGKRRVDTALLSAFLEIYATEIKFAVVEEVGAMTYTNARGEIRGQGAASSFAFGKAAGALEGVLTALRIPIVYVKPAVWKMLMAVGADKDTSRQKASDLFPNDAPRWSRKKDDGRAEALLLAYFGAQKFLSNGNKIAK
jgi:crossover junction endodeoxyribonuclease RuvC